jgi:hypothetical protein
MDQIARTKQLEVVLRRAEQRLANAENAGKTGLRTRIAVPQAVGPSALNEPEYAACSAG